mgnify:CR=1 FL=1
MYDVARHKWGAKWRMPRVAEVDELIDECTWEPMKIGDQCGCKITGKNGNSINTLQILVTMQDFPVVKR